jgi:DNA-binding XRE family transcriptional regulator
VVKLFSLYGLGKPRSKFGKWVDENGIVQTEIAKQSGLSNTTISKMCNDENYVPKWETWIKVQKVLKSWGHNVERKDFFQ